MFFVVVCLIAASTAGTPSSTLNEKTNETERFSKVRYLIVQDHTEVETSRPLFYWDTSTLATTTIATTEEYTTNSYNVTKFSKEANVLKSTKNIKKKTKNKAKRKKRRKQRKRNRKNKKNKISDIQVPPYSNITNTTSLQDLIVKLNNNPEISHKDLLGNNKLKQFKDRAIKLSVPLSTSISSRVSTAINSDNYENTNTILLEAGEKTKSATDTISFYDPFTLIDTTAPVGTESIFKVNHKESENKVPSVNELLKPMNFRKPEDFFKNVNFSCKGGNNEGCAHFCDDNKFPKCFCLEGFKLGSDRKSCLDINECMENNGGCEKICNNIVGSYYCDCPPGLRISDNLQTCEDVNECLLRNGHGPCQDVCINTFGSYLCQCSNLNGTLLSTDKHTCEDVNECIEGKSGCSHGCINTHGRAFCTCPEGMEMSSNWKTCYDIDECQNEEIRKQCKYGCQNTIGSYRCMNFLERELNDQIPIVPDHISCPPLFPPKHGFFHCSRKKVAAGGFRAQNGRFRITNRPGTYCELVCPVGFKNVGGFRVLCSANGSWIGEKEGKCSPFSKPKLKCPPPLNIQLKPGQEVINIRFPPPKASVDWKYIESNPPWAKTLEGNLTQGHHWLTFKATDPYSKLSSKCIIYIVVKKNKI